MTVSGNFFTVLGVPAAAGRTFTDEETWDVGERRAMMSHRLWSSRFGSDPKIIGRIVDLGGFPVRVVGVTPASFTFPGFDPDIFRPTAFSRQQAAAVSFRRAHWLGAIGRLQDGVTSGAGRRCAAGCRETSAAGIPRYQHEHGRGLHTASSVPHRRRPGLPARPAGGRRIAPAYRLRERGQPAARTGGGSRT
jgi:hypothetical protein